MPCAAPYTSFLWATFTVNGYVQHTDYSLLVVVIVWRKYVRMELIGREVCGFIPRWKTVKKRSLVLGLGRKKIMAKEEKRA